MRRRLGKTGRRLYGGLTTRIARVHSMLPHVAQVKAGSRGGLHAVQGAAHTVRGKGSSRFLRDVTLKVPFSLNYRPASGILPYRYDN